MSDKEKWIRVVSNLNKLTQDRSLVWASEPPTEGLRERGVENTYTARYGSWILRLYSYNVEVEATTSGLVTALVYAASSRTKLITVRRTRLEIVDTFQSPLWGFPEVSGLEDLLRSAQYQVADVDGFVAAVLRGT